MALRSLLALCALVGTAAYTAVTSDAASALVAADSTAPLPGSVVLRQTGTGPDPTLHPHRGRQTEPKPNRGTDPDKHTSRGKDKGADKTRSKSGRQSPQRSTKRSPPGIGKGSRGKITEPKDRGPDPDKHKNRGKITSGKNRQKCRKGQPCNTGP